MTETRSYPRHIQTDAGDIEFRLMSRTDEAAVLDFARALRDHYTADTPAGELSPAVLAWWAANWSTR